MLLRFIGTDGSMGLRHGHIYRVHVESYLNGSIRAPLITSPVRCPYGTDELFWANWEKP